METAILHQWERSPFCGKVRKVMHHKEINFSVVNYSGLLGRKAAALSSVGQLPVLEYEGVRVQDSSDIVAFLETRVPNPPLIPVEPRARALALLIEDWADESLSWYAMAALSMIDSDALTNHIDSLCAGRPRWERIPVGIVVRRMYHQKLKRQGLGRQSLPDILKRLNAHFGSLETLLAQSAWLVGESISIADIAVSCQLDLLVRVRPVAHDLQEYPNLLGWLGRCA